MAISILSSGPRGSVMVPRHREGLLEGVPLPEASLYDLYVYIYSSSWNYVVAATSLSASDICSDDTCAYTPPVTLDKIDYKFKVRGRNVGSIGPYSPLRNFSVGVVPVATTTISPTGTIMDTTPTYEWNAVSGATLYDLFVYPSASSSPIVSAISLTATGDDGGALARHALDIQLLHEPHRLPGGHGAAVAREPPPGIAPGTARRIRPGSDSAPSRRG